MSDKDGSLEAAYMEEASRTGLDVSLIRMIRTEMRSMAFYDIGQTKSTLEKPLVVEAVKGKINNEIIAMASSALALGFIGRDIDSQNVQKLLTAVNIQSSPTVDLLLSIISFIKVKNHHPYLFAYYALEFMEKDPTSTNVLHIVRGLGALAPDAKIADQMVKYCKECETGSVKLEEIKLNGSEVLGEIFKKFRDVIINVYDTVADFTIMELSNVIKQRGLGEIPADAYPYICAIATLSVSGKEVDMGSIEEFVEASGTEPDEKVLKVISALRFKNQLAYVVAVYYLLAIGREPDIDNILDVVNAMDIHPDTITAKKALAYYNLKSVQKLA